MLTFTKLGKYGRLGNQLFEIAAMIGLSKKHNHKLLLPKWQYYRYFNWGIEEGFMTSHHIIKESHFHYADIQIPEKGIFDLLGYFQSEKYWINAKEDVLKTLSFKDEYKEGIIKKYAPLLENNPIAISIRRGDYVGNPNYELLPVEYYILALVENFPDWQDRNVIIFSDDMPWCKTHFGCFDNFYFADNKFNNNDKRLYFTENTSAIEQLCLMSLCNDFIISNSTFAWWGAYLANKGKVIYPAIYCKGKLGSEISFKDHYPEEWIKFDHRDKRINLKNVTFTIPVHFDHHDRFQNLSLNLCMLLQYFDTNVIIGEQGSDKFKVFEEWCEYIKFDDKEFHRTKMLNVMARKAKTPIVVNYDADIFLPPMQVLKAVFDLNHKDMVYPFDGRFARIPRTQFKNIESFLDIGILGGVEWAGTRAGDLLSVGGCLFVNKEAFFKAGGENEKFISYGPEDAERYDRFTKAGFKVGKVKGMIFHIDHFRGPNSLSYHKYFRANEDEYNKIKVMNKEEMLNYIKHMNYAN